MIKHIVLFTPRRAADTTTLTEQLTMLTARLKGASNFQAGPLLKQDPIARGYTFGFTIDFDDENALTTYLACEPHQKIGKELVEMADGGIDGLLVMDIKCG